MRLLQTFLLLIPYICFFSPNGGHTQSRPVGLGASHVEGQNKAPDVVKRLNIP